MSRLDFYFILVLLICLFGFNVNVAIVAFRAEKLFSFGVNLAFCIYWVLRIIELVFDL